MPSVVAAPVDRDERLAETAEAIKVLVKYRDVVVAVSDSFAGYAPETVDKLKALLKASPDKEATEQTGMITPDKQALAPAVTFETM